MPSNDYHFITRWQVQSTIAEVTRILEDAEDLVRWWPAVYLDVKMLEKGDEKGLGKVVSLYTKGWLPYTLHWNFRVTEVTDTSFTITAWGDFDGRGIWTFEQDGLSVNITYDWKISAEKPLLRYFSFIMKPIFAANHRWAMAKGEESLRLEVARRQAATPTMRALIPAPPQPAAIPVMPLVFGAAALLGAVLLLRALLGKHDA